VLSFLLNGCPTKCFGIKRSLAHDILMAVQYETLQAGQIRLLEILQDDGLSGQLRTMDLNNTPKYAALSYTWGPPSAPDAEKHPVTINGVSVETQENLHLALRQLGITVRQHGGLIWIDYLCINQRDLDERGSQVAMMKEIFEGATVIYAWVGLPSDREEARLAVELMYSFNKMLHEGLKAHDDNMIAVTAEIGPDSVGYPRGSEPDNAKGWQGIAEIFRRPYWSRTWIYQEATTPGRIWFVVGNKSFNDIHLSATVYTGREFARFPEFAEQFRDVVGETSPVWRLSTARTWREQKPSGHPLLSLMGSLRMTHCMDPRDKLYAALDLASDVDPGDFLIDYKRSLADLYIDAVRFSLRKQQYPFAFLEYVHIPASDSTHRDLNATYEPAMASWVPDWRQKIMLRSFAAPNLEYADVPSLPYDASKGTEPNLVIRGLELHVLGYCFDKIEDVFPIWDESNTELSTPQSWSQIVRRSYPKITEQACCRTLVADLRTKDVATGKGKALLRGGAVEWALITADSSSLGVGSRSRQDYMMQVLVGMCHGRRMGVTEGRKLGIFPAAAARGDVVAIFHGGLVPCVLRHAGRDGQYSFIGECYVDGMMDGEASEAGGKDDPARIDIVLI